MRYALLLCCAALAVGCGKRFVLSDRPAVPETVRAPYGEETIAFELWRGWRLEARDRPTSPVVLAHAAGAVLAVYVHETTPQESVQQVSLRWLATLLAPPPLFGISGVSDLTLISEEEAEFAMSGSRNGEPTEAHVRIRKIAGRAPATWIVVVAIGPSIRQPALRSGRDSVTGSFRFEP